MVLNVEVPARFEPDARREITMETNFEAMERARAQLARENLGVAFRTLVRDAESLVRATAGDLNERTREARVQLTAAIERSKVLGQQLKDHAVAGAHLADEAIHKQPYPLVGIAFGLGLLIGILVGRDRD
jgi:ElaB/YqjD/DUF883 family membrane-anchored ribosome-binding protein